MLEQRIQQHFFDCADLMYQAAETMSRPIAAASQAIVGCLTAGGKLLVCGHGVSQAQAEHVAALLVGSFERERPGLSAIVLGGDAALQAALAEENAMPSGWVKQLQAVGAPGDVLLLLAAGSVGAGLRAVVRAAHGKDMTVIALTGRAGHALADELTETDVLVAVPHDREARIHEVHLLALHSVCDAVDLQLMGEQDQA